MPRSSRSSRSSRPSKSRFSFYNLSTETLASMVWVDPAPMPLSEPILEEAEEESSASVHNPRAADLDVEKELPAIPVSSVAHETGHSLVYYLNRAQRYSSYSFAVFMSIHFTNTGIIPFLVKTVPASETYLLQARELYQTPITEPLLIGIPIIAHIGSGIALRFARRAQNLRRYGGEAPEIGMGSRRHKANVWPSFSWISVSGYCLAGMVGVHVGVNRILPLLVDGDSSSIGLGFVSHAFAKYPKTSWVVYSSLVATACGHIVWGSAKWLGFAPANMGWKGKGNASQEGRGEKKKKRVWKALHIVSIGTSVFWICGGLEVVAQGGLAVGWLEKGYNNLLGTIGL